MNRPDALNAISVEMIESLATALSDADQDDDVRVLILTGSGRAFCVGADIKQLIRWRTEPNLRERFSTNAPAMFRQLREFRRPIIAAVNGVAAAGGFELCCMADIIVASDDALIGDGHANFVGFGPVSAAIAARVLPQKVASELLFTGDMWTAHRLEQQGFVNRVVPAPRVMEAAHEIAHKIANKPPLALAAAKKLMRGAQPGENQTLLDEAFERAREIFETQDFMEGLTAFEERREPIFKGK